MTKQIKTDKPLKITKAHRELKIKQAIALLNDIVKIKLAPSSIHGIGVFAMRDIKKGDKLYADAIPHAFDFTYDRFDKLRPDVRDVLINHWAEIINGAPFLYPVTKMTAFINHSDNCNYDVKVDKVLKNIKAGDEITVDYKQVQNWDKIFPWLK